MLASAERPSAPGRDPGDPSGRPFRRAGGPALPAFPIRPALGCLRHDFSHAPTRPLRPSYAAAPPRHAAGDATAAGRRGRGRGGSDRRLRAVHPARRIRRADRASLPGAFRRLRLRLRVRQRVAFGVPDRIRLGVRVLHPSTRLLARQDRVRRHRDVGEAVLYVLRAWPAAVPGPGYDSSADAQKLIDAALRTAKSEGRTVLLDFGANWCGNCKAADKVFAQPQTAAILGASYQMVKIDIGGNSSANSALLHKYSPSGGTYTMPVLVVVSPSGTVRTDTHVTGNPSLTPEGINAFLRQWAS